MSTGNRIFLKRRLLDSKIISEFKTLPAANVADSMNRLCSLSPEINLMSRPIDEIMVGSALTVKVREGDNLFIHKALDMAKEGDVVVVSNNGKDRALIGEIMAKYAQKVKKIEGIVLDGPIRDSAELSEMRMSIYATGKTPGGPFKDGPGEINVPITCGGISINPGDVILGDTDGVIAIPINDVNKVLETAKKLSGNDNNKVKAASDGTLNRDWVEKLLTEKNYEVIDDYFNY